MIKLRMLNSCSGRHHLYLAGRDDRTVTHTVAVCQFPVQDNGYDFHIVMWMGSKAHSCLYRVVVQYPERPKVNTVGIVIIGKTKRMPGVQPTVICMSTVCCFVNCQFHNSVYLI